LLLRDAHSASQGIGRRSRDNSPSGNGPVPYATVGTAVRPGHRERTLFPEDDTDGTFTPVFQPLIAITGELLFAIK